MAERSRRSERRESAGAHPQWKALGRAIKLLRTERGLDRGELADASGLSYPYLSEIENGKKQPSTAALTAIAEALEMRPSELLESTEWSLGPSDSAMDALPMSMPAPPPASQRSWFRDEAASVEPQRDSDRGARAELLSLLDLLDPEDVQTLLRLATRLAQK